MKKIFLLLAVMITIHGYSQRITPALKRSYNWWQYVNPTNVNYFATFKGINPVNYDTGVVSYSKRTAISLVGWINHNVDLSTAISNDSLVHLESLVNLEQLLIGSNISDAGILHVRKLEKLRHFEVTLSGSQNWNITDESMVTLGGLTNMEILRLYFCGKVTDRGIQLLTRLVNLKELTLNGTGISDKGLSYLRSFPKLETLGLAATNITDEGVAILIEQLPSLPALKTVVIFNSKISVEGRHKLIASRKGLTVSY